MFKYSLIFSLFILESCTGLYIPIPGSLFFQRREVSEKETLNPTQKYYFENMIEKSLEEIKDCENLGKIQAEDGGSLSGRWRAQKKLKIKAAKNLADTVVFESHTPWNIEKTVVTGYHFRCKKKIHYIEEGLQLE